MVVAVRIAVATVDEVDEGNGEKREGFKGFRGRLVRRIYWKIRAEIRRRSGRRKRVSSRYDLLSYALNFDDGDSYF